MASGYMIDESLGFCTEYFSLYEHVRSRVWDPEEELRDSGECLLGKPKPKTLTDTKLDSIHDYVIRHSVHTEELLSEWSEQRRLYKSERLAFANSHRRHRVSQVQYPAHLSEPFPKFAPWLNHKVRMLKDEGFPVTRELESLHCPPSQHAWSFNSMWAYGCHYTCNAETAPTTVAFDCGIAAIPPTPICTEIDVGILRNIILVTYMGLNCVLMEGSWIKTNDQGRRVVKKDQNGFWIVQFSSRETRPKDNPYVFPESVSQVFFMDDRTDPSWKVVMRHDPRSKRIEGDREIYVFGAAGSTRPTLSARSLGILGPLAGRAIQTEDAAEEFVADQVNAFIHEGENPDDERHLDDTQYEDEFEIQYVE